MTPGVRSLVIVIAIGGLGCFGIAGPARSADRTDSSQRHLGEFRGTKAPVPDAEMLLDLDLLKDADFTKRRDLLRRLELLERLPFLERLPTLEGQSEGASGKTGGGR